MKGLHESGLPDHTNPRHVPGRSHVEWCKQRALSYLSAAKLGYLGNTFGQLTADLMRDETTKSLIEKLHAIPTTEQALRNFIETELK